MPERTLAFEACRHRFLTDVYKVLAVNEISSEFVWCVEGMPAKSYTQI